MAVHTYIKGQRGNSAKKLATKKSQNKKAGKSRQITKEPAEAAPPFQPQKIQPFPSRVRKTPDSKSSKAPLLPKGEFFDKRINLSHPNFERFMFHFQEITHIFEKNPEVEKNRLAKATLASLNFESATSLTMRADGDGNQTLIAKFGKKEAQLAQGKDFTSMHITDGKSATHLLRRGGSMEVLHFPGK